MTLPTFISKSAIAGTTGLTLTVAYPASLLENDLIILVVGSTSSSAVNAVTTPASPWVHKHALEPVVAKGQQGIYYRFVPSGGLTGSLALDVQTPTANAALYGVMYAFRGADITTPFEGGNLNSGSADPITMPAVTTFGTDRLAVAFAFDSINFAGSLSNPTGETGGDWTTFSSNALATGDVGSMFAFSAAMATAGTITGGSVATGLTGTWAIRAFAIRSLTPVSTTLDIRRDILPISPLTIRSAFPFVTAGLVAQAATPNFAVLANDLLIIDVATRQNLGADPLPNLNIISQTHTGTWSWTKIQVDTGSGARTVTARFMAIAPAGSTGQLTVNNGTGGTSTIRWKIAGSIWRGGLLRIPDNNISEGVSATPTAPIVTLPNVVHSDAAVFGAVWTNVVGPAIAPGTNFTELLEAIDATASSLELEYCIGNPPQAASWTTTGAAAVSIASEIYGLVSPFSKALDIRRSLITTTSISKALDIRRSVTTSVSKTLDIRRVITVPISKALDIRRSVTTSISKTLDVRRAITVPISKPVDIRRSVTTSILKALDVRRAIIATVLKALDIRRLVVSTTTLTVNIPFPFIAPGGTIQSTTTDFAVLTNDLVFVDVAARQAVGTDPIPNFSIINQTHTGTWTWTRIQVDNGVTPRLVAARFMAIAPNASTGRLTVTGNTGSVQPIRWKVAGAIWRGGLPIVPNNNVSEGVSSTPTAPVVALPNPVHSDAAVFGVTWVNAVGPAVAPGTNFTELQEAIDATLSTLEQEYRIGSPPQAASWTATGTQAVSIVSEIYGLVSPISKAIDVRRVIIQSISSVLDIRRVVTAAISKDLDVRRSVVKIVSDTVDIRRSITLPVSKLLDIRRSTISVITDSIDIRRAVSGPVSKVLDIRRSVVKIVSDTVDIRRSIFITAAKTLNLRRSITVIAANTAALSRLILGAAVKSLDIRRRINIIFLKPVDIRRAVVGRIGRDLDIRRAVIGKVTKSLDIRRSLTTSVAKALDIRRSVTILASDTIDLRRSVTIFASDTLDIRRSILHIISDSVTLERTVGGAVARSLDIRRNTNVVISKLLDLRRSETVSTARTLDLRRVVIGNIARTLQIRRDMIGRVSDTLDIRRSVLAAAVDALQLERRILSIASRVVDLRRSLTTSVIKPLDIRRGVIARLTKNLTVIRSVQFRVTSNLSVRRDIISALTIFTGVSLRRSIIARTTANLDLRRVLTVPVSKSLTVARSLSGTIVHGLDIRRSLTISISRPLSVRRSITIPVSQRIDFRRTIVIITSDSLNILRRVDARTGRPLDTRRQISAFTAANLNLRRKVLGLGGETGIRIDHVITAKWQIAPIRGTMQPTVIRGKMGYPQ